MIVVNEGCKASIQISLGECYRAYAIKAHELLDNHKYVYDELPEGIRKHDDYINSIMNTYSISTVYATCDGYSYPIAQFRLEALVADFDERTGIVKGILHNEDRPVFLLEKQMSAWASTQVSGRNFVIETALPDGQGMKDLSIPDHKDSILLSYDADIRMPEGKIDNVFMVTSPIDCGTNHTVRRGLIPKSLLHKAALNVSKSTVNIVQSSVDIYINPKEPRQLMARPITEGGDW